MKLFRFYPTLLIITALSSVFACSGNGSHSAEDREALFDYIVEKTIEREAFSPVKNDALNFDPIEEMKKYRDEVIAADTDEKLYYALVKLSNARKDRHLSVSRLQDGLKVVEYDDTEIPVKFAVDYGTTGEYFLFISDFAENIADYSDGTAPETGDKLTAVNGQAFEDYFKASMSYYRYSTVNGLWWKFAEGLSVKDNNFPPEFYKNDMTYSFEKITGEHYSVTLPYLDSETINWMGYWKKQGDFSYPGFEKLFSVQTYDLYKATDGNNVLLLDWYGFREDLVTDMDLLIDYADENGLLDYALILDATRSRGGSKGAYAIQKLVSKPFKTTFGNLRISDVTAPFIQERIIAYNAEKIEDSGVKETIDDGSWLIDWLKTDVTESMLAGDEYSNNVPFKCAHLPKDSDGFLQPAEIHFSGPLVCFLGPDGGSHLDQFAAIVVENNLCHVIGMPAGGYSNTWEWEEYLVFPTSKKPVVTFMWNIGHTISPKGYILEGNPTQVHDYISLTRDNYIDYYKIMIDRAYEYFGLK
ncbi:hypothetical protein ACFL6I_03300 [candidate division KSB1 bacterium]